MGLSAAYQLKAGPEEFPEVGWLICIPGSHIDLAQLVCEEQMHDFRCQQPLHCLHLQNLHHQDTV